MVTVAPSYPRAVNRHGDLAVWADGRPVAHRNGRVVPLPGVENASQSEATTLSDDGAAAGYVYYGYEAGQHRGHPLLWRGC